MTDDQILFLMRLALGSALIQNIAFSDDGNMTVAYFDGGMNFHIATLTAEGYVRTEEV